MRVLTNRSSSLAHAIVSFVLLAHGAAGAWAQAVPVIGYVANANASAERHAAFVKRLAELGYVDGRTIRIDYRNIGAETEYDGAMADLVARKVDLIVAGNASAAPAAAKATTTIPIVLAAVNDPVGLGVVQSLERPGRNVTGTTIYAPQLIAERVRLLQRLVPRLDRIGVFVNGNNRNNAAQLEAIRGAAKTLGIDVVPIDIRGPSDVEPAVERAREAGARALMNCVDSFINSRRFVIGELAGRYRIPALFTDKEYVLAGSLMALGVGHLEGYAGAADYVDKVLRGARPETLAIAPPSTRTLSVSRKALDRLGLSLPDDLRSQVDEWLP
jgi:putative ABC transport system substrate-binding protein